MTFRIIGFVVCLLLTLLAFSLIAYPGAFHLTVSEVVLVIINLAVLQAIVQTIFFLNLFGEKGVRWNVGVFVSTLSIIFVIIFFSIWIMDHLNYNMMPMLGLGTS